MAHVKGWLGVLGTGLFCATFAVPISAQTNAQKAIDRQRQVDALLLEQRNSGLSLEIGAVGLGTGANASDKSDSVEPFNTMVRQSVPVRPSTKLPLGTLALSLAAGGGYDTNPRTSPDAEGAWFAEFDVNPSWKFAGPERKYTFGLDLTNEQVLTFGYDGILRFYERDFRDRDRITQGFSGNFKQRLGERSIATLSVKDVWIYTNLSPTLNSIAVIPSVQHYWTHWLVTEPQYAFTHTDVLVDVPAIADQSGNSHALGLNLTLLTANEVFPENDRGPFPTGIFQSLTFGYAHTWNETDGASQAYDGDRVIVKLVGFKVGGDDGVGVDVTYAHDWNAFRNVSSQNNRRHRDDDIDTAGISVKRVFDLRDKQKLSVVLNANFTNNDSSALAKQYDRTIVSASVSWSF